MIVKIGNVELTEEEAKKAYENNLFVCSFCGIYQIHHSANAGYYGHKVIEYKGYARRGRFYIHDAKTINKVIGKNILTEG